MEVRDKQFGPLSLCIQYKWLQQYINLQITAKGAFTNYIIIFDLNNIVPSGQEELLWPPAVNVGSCDFKDVAACCHNKLCLPPDPKFVLSVKK